MLKLFRHCLQAHKAGPDIEKKKLTQCLFLYGGQQIYLNLWSVDILSISSEEVRQICRSFRVQATVKYYTKPSYSHCVELGRTDCHFFTAARVTPPTDNGNGVGPSQLACSGDHSRAKPAKTWLSVCQSLAMSSG